jgi:hypothetical protein
LRQRHGRLFLPGFFERNPQLKVEKLYWELDGTFRIMRPTP